MSDPIDIWIQAWAESVTHLGVIGEEAREGVLDAPALQQHAVTCAHRAVDVAGALFDWWVDRMIPEPTDRLAGPGRTVATKVAVPPSAADTRLVADGFRVHGHGDAVAIPSQQVAFDASALANGQLGVTVTLPAAPGEVILHGDIYQETLSPAGAVTDRRLVATIRIPSFRSDPAP